jgi:hypothetical protein
MKKAVLVVSLLFLAVAPNVQAHNTKSVWTETKAEGRVKAAVRLASPRGAVDQASAELREAQARHDACEQRNCSEMISAITALSEAQDAYDAATRGFYVKSVECVGSGSVTRGFYFKHFRCRALFYYGDDPKGWMRLYVHVIGPSQLSWQRI